MSGFHTESVRPLNSELYSLLENKFGEVKIANPGSAASIQRFADPFHPGRVIQRARWWGEYYCVCCPFCNDVDHKLWINHLYGKDYDSKLNRRTHTFLAHCYKNGCLSAAGRSLQLEQIIFGPGRRLNKSFQISVGDVFTAPETLDPPGTIVPLSDLPIEHAAVQYLAERNFDANELAALFDVGVCVDAAFRYRSMVGKIFIPGYFNKKLVVWQGRLAREPRHKGEIKYYTQGKKSRALYNYDASASRPFAVLVEGCPSVWRLGSPAVGLFGKTLSGWQENTVATTWSGRPVFIVLDSDAGKEIERATAQLCRHNLQVVPVLLPDSRDPADYSRNEFQRILAAAAVNVGVAVDVSCLGAP